MTDKLKQISIPEDLYESLQELKQVFSEMTWEDIKEDADVIGILLSAFIDSVQWWEEWEIVEEEK